MSWLLVAAFAGCAAQGTQTCAYKLYPGPECPAVSILSLGDAHAVEIDGRPVSHADWTEVHLLPGTHAVRWPTKFLEPSGFATGGSEARVELAAGRISLLRSDHTTGPGDRSYFWIEEPGAGCIVAGEAKP